MVSTLEQFGNRCQMLNTAASHVTACISLMVYTQKMARVHTHKNLYLNVPSYYS